MYQTFLISATPPGKICLQKVLLRPSISQKSFPAVKKLRLRGIGVSIGMAGMNQNLYLNEYQSFSAVVFPPEAVNVFDTNSKKARPPVIFEAFGVTKPGAVRIIQSPAITNIDPRGEWHLQISPNYLWPGDTKSRWTDPAILLDVKLHLRVTAQVNKDPASWSDFAA
jgi:hypothetical protein